MVECVLKFFLSCGAMFLLGFKQHLRWAGLQRWLRQLLGLGVVAAFVLMLAPLWHPAFGLTSLVQSDVAARERVLPVLHGQPIDYRIGGYDGQYYAQLACDPSLRTPELSSSIDNLSYRARRMLLPATAWMLAGGDAPRAFRLYPWLNVACWFLLAALLWRRFCAEATWAGLVAWSGFMFSAGVMASVRLSLTDMPSLLLFALAMRAADRGRPGTMCGWFAASLLARETMLVGAWGLLPERADGWRSRLRAGLWIALAAVPLAAWLVYVHLAVGAPQHAPEGTRNFAWPVVGIVHRWQELAGMIADPQKNRWLVWVSVIGMISMTAQFLFVLLRWEWRNAWWRVAASFVVLALLLGDAVWEGFPGAALRVLLPLLLACNVLALSARWKWVWLVLFNLSFVVMAREFNPGRNDVSAVGSRHSAAVVTEGQGCYGPERRRWDCWVWTQRDAVWQVQAWGGPTQYVVSGRVRSPDEREVALVWQGREIWRGRTNPKWTRFLSEPFRIEAGASELHIVADRPGVIESPNPDARSLSECFLNVRLDEVGRQ